MRFSPARRRGRRTRSRRRRRTRPVRDNALAHADSVEIKRQPEAQSAGEAWQALLARYSASAAVANAPAIPIEGLDAALREAGRLIARYDWGVHYAGNLGRAASVSICAVRCARVCGPVAICSSRTPSAIRCAIRASSCSSTAAVR